MTEFLQNALTRLGGAAVAADACVIALWMMIKNWGEKVFSLSKHE